METHSRPPGNEFEECLHAIKGECNSEHLVKQQQKQQVYSLPDIPAPHQTTVAAVATAAAATTTKPTEEAESAIASSKTEPSTKHSCTNDGLLLQICGKGELIVIFPAETGSGENGQEDVGKLSLSVETTTPVELKVPTAKGVEGVDVQCRGSIDLHLKAQGNGKEVHVQTPQTKTDTSQTEPGGESVHFTKGHRRNNSDFLYVSGEPNNAEVLTDTPQDPKARVQDEVDAKYSMSADPRVPFDNTAVKNIDTSDVIASVSDDFNQVCSDLSKLTRDFTQSRDKSTRVNLYQPIRDNFTQLLQEIRLVSLCDHLYQNHVIELETYQSLYEGNKTCRTGQDCIRQLLMTLSCMSVKKVPLLKALLESDHKDIIPMMLPVGQK